MALPGLVASNNLSDVLDKEKAWDNLGLNISANFLIAGLDLDASAYLSAVMQADGVGLEPAVQAAINNFVVGCKTDGIWNAIKASCILAGARTLNGALTPLVGAAPSNVGPFTASDYDRKTGLISDGSKYLNSNRDNNADPQDSQHLSVFVSTPHTFNTSRFYIGGGGNTNGASHIGTNTTPLFSFRSRSVNVNIADGSVTGFVGINRSESSSFSYRSGGVTNTSSTVSIAPVAGSIAIFNRNPAGSSNGRIAFYSIGESLNLSLLNARLTTLINAFAASLP